MKRIFVLAAIVNGLFSVCKAQTYSISTIAGVTATHGYSGDGGSAVLALIDDPEDVVKDKAGYIYFNQFSPYPAIRRVTPAGIITTIAGTGIHGYTGDGGPATAAMLTSPRGMAIDKAGNIFIGDDGNYLIRKIDTAGIITTIAGTGTQGYSGDGGAATAARLYYINNIAVDQHNRIYIVDAYATLRRIDSSGVISTVGGTHGVTGFSGDGGPATLATFNNANTIATDQIGNVYVADLGNKRIRKIDTFGIITTIAGTGVFGNSGDGGLAVDAQIYPTHVQTDMSGNVYFSDAYHSVIRKINTAGIITTIAGNGTHAYGGDGNALLTSLSLPLGMVVDSLGDIYFADNGSARIRKLHNESLSAGPVLQPVGKVTFCPNPATDRMVIKTAAGAYDWYVVSNTIGQQVLQGEVSGIETELNVQLLPPGFFYLSLTGSARVEVYKFVKQ
ncbi:MAG: T9SS type A sorting domain-containing protein [Bacteroidota bacterium]